ncbi:MAG TPA: hypothetical protein VLR26_14095 [Frankiaceae bacterium]|nr:hypothetical protein [Frankiaceae bacterium]
MSAKKVLNVTVRPGSPAHTAYHRQVGLPAPEELRQTEIAAGFTPRPDLDLTYRGGHTIADLVFLNCYLAVDRWDGTDRANIDQSLSAAMSDPDLENVIAQYFRGPISSAMLPAQTSSDPVGAQFFKDQAEAKVAQLLADGVLGGSDPASSVICLLLPPGAVLVDGLSTAAPSGETANPSAGADSPGPAAPAKLLDTDAADSKHGLGGFHGSVDVTGIRVYYAIAVYSEGDNGIPVFDQSWKNVVATLYHELNEARTDADVDVVNATGDMSLLGWYSDNGGEIGDIPIATAPDINLVMQEVSLTDNSATVPVQFEWSDAVHGPEGPIPVPH